MEGMWRDCVTSLGGLHTHPATRKLHNCWGLHTSFHISKWHTNMHIHCMLSMPNHTDTLCTVTYDLSHSLTAIKLQHCQGHDLCESVMGEGAVVAHWCSTHPLEVPSDTVLTEELNFLLSQSLTSRLRIYTHTQQHETISTVKAGKHNTKKHNNN